MVSISRTVLVWGLIVVGSLVPAARCGEDDLSAGAAQKPKSPVTISKETTRITEPLRANGYVDYIAALNQHCSQGVTPENNAAVLIIQAMGPKEIPQEIREQYFKMLGIPPLPEEGQYLVAYDEFAERTRKAAAPGKELSDAEREKLWDEEHMATSRPWSKEALPTVAAWLEGSEGPIALIIEATKRPRRYDPLISTSDPPMSLYVLLPMVLAHRHAARALTARAMFRLGAGNVEQAWQDLLSCHQLSRLTGRGSTIVEMLVAIAIDGVACAGDRTLLAHGNLTAAQARQMRDDLQKLPPLPKMVDAIDVGERYMFLDSVQALADRGLGEFNRIVGGSGEDVDESSMLGKALSGAGALVVKWDVILQMGNSWYDRLVAAQRKPTWSERSAAMAKIDADLTELSKHAKDFKSLALSMLGGPERAVSERVGQIVVALWLPATNACTEAEARAAENFEVVKLGFLLAAYRAEHGKYPTQLSDLTPKYLAEVPLDPFSGKPLTYKPQPSGYVLYSVGVNGKDDGGLSYDDRPTMGDIEKDYDDLVVQVPLKQRETQPQ